MPLSAGPWHWETLCPGTLPGTLPQSLTNSKLAQREAEFGYWPQTPLASRLNSRQNLEDQDYSEDRRPVLPTRKH